LYFYRSSESPKPNPEYLKHAGSQLGLAGNLRLTVTLPEGEDLNEWLAINSMCIILFISVCRMDYLSFFLLFFLAFDFYNQIHMLFRTISEFCTLASCPTMNAGPK